MEENKNSTILSGIELNLNMNVQLAIIVLMVGTLMWTIFFTTMPATHSFFHAARHSIGIIACH